MLKGISPLLTGGVLSVLDSMGHGDTLGVVDCNFPARSHAERVIELPSVRAVAAWEAVLSVLPIDTFQAPALWAMQTDDGDDGPLFAVIREATIANCGQDISWCGVPRPDFYPLAREAIALIRTGESAPYACFLMAKGIVTPPPEGHH